MYDTTFQAGISPEATAALIEAIASDRAARMKVMAKATVIMCVQPEWMRAEEVNAFFGIPNNQLLGMVRKGGIKARKLDPYLRGSATIFCVEDIRRAIDRLTPYDEWLRTRPDLKGEGGEGKEQGR